MTGTSTDTDRSGQMPAADTGAAMVTPADALSAHFCLARPGYPPPPGHGRFKPPIYVHAVFFSTWSVRPQTYFLLPGKLLSIL